MIPRLKPALGLRELIAALRPPRKDDVERFERAFAELVNQKYALAFPYGRTGLLLLLEALGLKNKEIICPAYTCVVVPHAIVYSGNTPVFVDCQHDGFNMDLDLVEMAITASTSAIIATSLFGYPVNLDRLDEIRRRHPHIHIIQDCAHSFTAEWKGRPVQREGIAALFGLNISKILTSVFGGMVTTDEEELYETLKLLRDRRLEGPDSRKGFRRLMYLVSVYPVFWGPLYAVTNSLERANLLNHFVRYYDDTKIDMPVDYLKKMSRLEARVGLANLKRYRKIIEHRRAAAEHYSSNLAGVVKNSLLASHRPTGEVNISPGLRLSISLDKDFVLPPNVEGATFSHFVIQVADRERFMKWWLARGVQLGSLIEYSIPEMSAYGGHRPEEFPVAARYARTTVNLPVWGGLNVSRKVMRSNIRRRSLHFAAY